MTAVLLRDTPRTPLPEALERLTRLVSPYTGVVRTVEEFLTTPDDPRLVNVQCEAAEGASLLGSSLDHLDGGGGAASPSRDVALAAAIGELAERYSAAYVPGETLLVGCADELGGACVAPKSWSLFAPEQHADPRFPFAPFTSTTRIRWVRAFSLLDGRPALVPAQLVFLADDVAQDETRIAYATSNGLACGPTLAEAVLSGLLELVERDAFMLCWLNRLSRPLLDWSEDDEISELDARYFASTGLEYAVVDLSAFLRVPTALGVVHGIDGDDAALGVGAAAAPTAREAWLKALTEAFAVRAWARTLRRLEPPRRFDPDFSDVRSFADHVSFYGQHENASRAQFLDSCPRRRPIADVPSLPGERPVECIRAVVNRLRSVGARAYAVDVTSPDLRAAGLHVAKVVSPELCPLDVAYEARFLGGRRLYTASAELGLVAEPFRFEHLNRDPHPFP